MVPVRQGRGAMMIDSAAIAPLAAGLLLLVFGGLLYRVVLGVAGGILGGAVGLGLGVLVAALFGLSQNGALVFQAIGAIAGIAGGVWAFRVANALGFFLFGAAIGAWLFVEVFALIDTSGFSADPDLVFALGIPVAAAVCGLVVAALNRYVIALASALVGTLLVMAALHWPLGGWLAPFVFVAGLAIQMRFVRRRRDDDEEDEGE